MSFEGNFRSMVRRVQHGKITQKEKSKLWIYVAMVIFGTMFISSLKELFIDDFMTKYSPETILIVGMGGIVGLYYLLEIK